MPCRGLCCASPGRGSSVTVGSRRLQRMQWTVASSLERSVLELLVKGVRARSATFDAQMRFRCWRIRHTEARTVWLAPTSPQPGRLDITWEVSFDYLCVQVIRRGTENR